MYYKTLGISRRQIPFAVLLNVNTSIRNGNLIDFTFFMAAKVINYRTEGLKSKMSTKHHRNFFKYKGTAVTEKLLNGFVCILDFYIYDMTYGRYVE